jgi:PAS domain S-box-containing protein
MRAAVGVTEEKVIELSGIAANGSQASSIWYVATLKAQADERKWRVFAQEVVGSPEEARGNPSRNLGYRIQQANLCMQRNEADSWTLFTPYKKLCTTDEKLVLTLQERMEMFCITDPAMHDNPIVFVSDDFVDMTGYSRHAINGINCRFLQGADTSPEDVDVIRDALLYEKHARVTLLNYRKDGTRFINQFALSPLREESGKLAYFIGVQIDVEDVDIQPFPNSRQTMAEMLLEFEEGVEAA